MNLILANADMATYRTLLAINWNTRAESSLQCSTLRSTPHAAHVIEMLFDHDHESVQAFELQRLDKPFHMCPQIR